MQSRFSRIFFRHTPHNQNTSQTEIDKHRLLALMQWAIPLFPSWSVFDYYLDRQHFAFFFTIRIAYVFFAVLLFLFLKRQTIHQKIIALGVTHSFLVIFCIGVMIYFTHSFLPYALGMSIAFIMPSILMSWKPRYTIGPGLVAYFFILAPIGFLKNLEIDITDMVTVFFWDGTMLVASSVFSFIGYRYVVKVTDLTNNLQAKVQEKTLELNEKNQTLEQANLKLTELDQKKDNFLANTSHELRTPLNGILGLTKFLIKSLSASVSPERIKDLKLIEQSGNRLNYLINDILDFSKMRKGDFYLSLTEVNLHNTLSKIQPLIAPQMQSKNIHFSNDLPDDLPTVLADENRIQQILYNLMGNAIKFTHQGEIRLYAEIEKDHLKICVTDTGIGIASDKLDAIFNAFEQADGSISRSYGGTGLGLSVTKQLVELHKGKIGVTSTPGAGSNFYFTLPIVNEKLLIELRQNNVDNQLAHHGMKLLPTEEPTEENSTDAINENIQLSGEIETNPLAHSIRFNLLKNAKVLVVDDDSINIVVTERHLASMGTQVISALSGEMALELIKQESPDLVLLDIMMPGMNGYAVAEKIRAEISEFLPIIMLTALQEESGALYKGFISGANDFLSKPYDEMELFSRLESALHQQALIRAEQQVREDKILLLKSLAAGIAHEIKTPLGLMMGHAQVGITMDASEQEYSDKVKTKFDYIYRMGLSGEQIINLILNNMKNQFMDNTQFSRLSALTLTNKAVEEYSFGYKFNRGLEEKIRIIQDNDFEFTGSETVFIYLLFNLLKNAIYYLKSTPNNHIEIWLEPGEENNRLYFKDYGPGITPEMLPHIFESFLSVGKKDGTGLGLPFCKRAMLSFSGDIHCETEAGKYTVFVLTFPKIG